MLWKYEVATSSGGIFGSLSKIAALISVSDDEDKLEAAETGSPSGSDGVVEDPLASGMAVS